MMHGAIHHIELYVSDLKQTKAFYEKLLRQLGYQSYQSWELGFSMKLGEQYIVFVQTEAKQLASGYHRKNIGLNHLAFAVETSEVVDKWRAYLAEQGIPLLYEDAYPYAGGADHYAVFFEDPDRIKLEIVAVTDR